MTTAAATNGDPASDQDAQERAVGISVFVRPDAPGFKCTLKHRYTDFLVNEILPDGHVLHLSNDPAGPEKKRKRGKDEGESHDQKRQRANGKEETISGAETETTKIISKDVESKQEPDSNPSGNAASEPVEVKRQTEASSAPAAASSASVDSVKEQAIASISSEDKTVLANVFGNDVSQAILNLYASVVAYPDRKARDHATVKSDPLAEKSKRTEAHMCIRRIFASKLETLTVQDQDHQSGPGTIIAVKAAPPKSAVNPNASDRNAGGNPRGKEAWSDLGGEYLHFTLYKENKDTMEVLYFLASQLKMHIKHFSFAGTKDRRAVTVQRVAVHRIRRERIEALNRLSRGWRLGGPWEYCKDALDLGMLGGNEFLLTLRDVVFEGQLPEWDMQRKLQHAGELAQTAAKSMGESGFINYYGLQRFGTYSVGTHTVGMKMLKGDLKGAIDAILSYDSALLEENQSADGQDRKVPQDDISRATAIHEFNRNWNSNEALSRLPSRFSAERGIITHLGKYDRKAETYPNKNDYQGALNMIQRNLRLMYVHAYQSYVWNTIAGKRFESFGVKVTEGDLVVVGEKERQEGQASTAVTDEVDEDGEPIIHPSASAAAGTEEAQHAPPPASGDDDVFVRARPLSKAESDSGRYTVFDLVLPLPGFDVLYPKNENGKLYEDFMGSEQGGGLDPQNMRRAWKDISLPGGYRKVMARPLGSGVEIDVRAYIGPEDQLVETDLEKLRRTEAKDGSDSVLANGSQAEKDKIAIVLKLQLGSSQYATMALRELTKGGAVGYRPQYSVANR